MCRIMPFAYARLFFFKQNFACEVLIICSLLKFNEVKNQPQKSWWNLSLDSTLCLFVVSPVFLVGGWICRLSAVA